MAGARATSPTGGTQRWPDDLKTFKNISYWERWPAATGYAPSLEVLTKLAELYECHVADLLADGADHRASDPVYRARTRLANLPATIASGGRLHDDPNADRRNGRRWRGP